MFLTSANPYNQTTVGQVTISTKNDVERAVKKARQAFSFWRAVPVKTRSQYLLKLVAELVKQKPKLAKLIALEMGKPYTQSLSEIDWMVRTIKYFSDQAPKILADEIIEKNDHCVRRVVREPIGVAAVISPWNYPIGVPLWGIAPILLSGNTVVFKPSEETPLCGQAIADILTKIGLDKGVFNIIHGNGQVGAMLVDQPIDFVWFTGSNKTGQEIYAKCGAKFIRGMFELGGSSPAIVLKNADLDDAAAKIYQARFGNCGQVCSAIKRLFVERRVYQALLDRLVTRASQTRLGDPLKPSVTLGPLVSKKQLLILETQVGDAVKKGAKVAVGGKRPDDLKLKSGNFYLPTILTNIKPTMRVMTEEVFGPVLPVVPFDDIETAIKLANQTDYGLTAQVYTQNLKLAKLIASKIEAGTIAINSNSYSTPATPFGGYKKSGLGREGGKYGFYEYTQIKYVYEQ